MLFKRSNEHTCTPLGSEPFAGHSKGANDVLLYASQYDDVPLVVNIAARFDLSRGIKVRYMNIDIYTYLCRYQFLHICT